MLAAPIDDNGGLIGTSGGGHGSNGGGANESASLQVAQAQLGIPKPLCYGYVRARGNMMVLGELADKSRVCIILLAEGEWDGIERFWINSKLVDPTDTSLIHFHPGIDGTLGGGLAETSTGGDQAVDSFFALLPANIQPQTFSRTAFIALHVPPDPGAPSAVLDWIGDFRTTRCRIFDNAGAQTAYQFTVNPAWQIHDLLLRTVVKPEALINEALTAAEKARFGFASFKDNADYNAAVLANGRVRFQNSVAWPSRSDLKTRLQQLLMISRSYIVEAAGKIYLYSDKARNSTFILTAAHVRPNTFKAAKPQLRGTANRLQGKYNDLLTSVAATVDIIANSGATRAGGVATLKTLVAHPFKVNDTIVVQRVSDATFNATAIVVTVPTTSSLTYANPGADVAAATAGGGIIGMPESIFTPRTMIVDHEQHQAAVGQRGVGLTPTAKRVPIDLDFGNCTGEQIQRTERFIAVRNLGADAAPYSAPFQVQVECWHGAVDANGQKLLDRLPGEHITLDASVSEEFQRDYEIMKATFKPLADSGASGASQNLGTIALDLTEYIAAAFTDASDTEQPSAPLAPPIGLIPITEVDANGKLIIVSSTPLNPQGSLIPMQPIIITIAYTDTTIDLSWASQGMLRSDGSTLTLPADTKSYATLSASTAYYLYSYIRVSDGTLQFVNGSPPPTSPNSAYATQAYLDGRNAISVMVITTAAPAGSGGGTGGGGDVCPEAEEFVDIFGRGQVRAIDAEVGELILGEKVATAERVYRRIIAKRTKPSAAWRIVNGHRISPCEPVWVGGRWTAAFQAPGAALDMFVGIEAHLTVEADADDENNYTLVAGQPLTIHNSLPGPVC
jgi:hypothetical protein